MYICTCASEYVCVGMCEYEYVVCVAVGAKCLYVLFRNTTETFYGEFNIACFPICRHLLVRMCACMRAVYRLALV